MRKFKLWNYLMTESIDLNTSKYLVSNVSGLGTNYRLNKVNSTVIGFKSDFEPITFTMNFGINGNPYLCYNKFMNFIANNGDKKLILEYDIPSPKNILDEPKTMDDIDYAVNANSTLSNNGAYRICSGLAGTSSYVYKKVFLNPGTYVVNVKGRRQVTAQGIVGIYNISSNDRIGSSVGNITLNEYVSDHSFIVNISEAKEYAFAYWPTTTGYNGNQMYVYSAEILDVSSSNIRYCDVYLKNAPKTQKTNFNIIQENIIFERVSFWYEFVYGSGNDFQIENFVIEPCPVTIHKQPNVNQSSIFLKNTSNEIISEIILKPYSSDTLVIDSENKIITRYAYSNPNIKTNGYDLINKSKDTFMYIPKGKYVLSSNNYIIGHTLEWVVKRWLND